MKPHWFYHPDYCPKVIARRANAELLELMGGWGNALATRGRSLVWSRSMEGLERFRQAQYRLRKQGLLVHHHADGRLPGLVLTDAGERALDDIARPQRWWDAKWPGRWFVVIYDVPERERGYRAGLRQFLRRLRMGCLQGSVWISPRDIRPQYDDLVEAGGAASVAHLLEARTVLGQSPQQLVEEAWAFEALARGHAWYEQMAKRAQSQVESLAHRRAALLALAREDLAAYRRVMESDPLLPRALWPPTYRGERVFKLHRALQHLIALHL